jgi:hypothetical protein
MIRIHGRTVLFAITSVYMSSIVCLAQRAITGADYHVRARYQVPGQGSWNFLTVDDRSDRIYLPHGATIQVLDAQSGQILGEIQGTLAYSVAIASDLHKGYTTNDRTAIAFDTDSLKITARAQINPAQAILYDPETKRVFFFSDKTTVLDAVTFSVLGVIEIGKDTQNAVTNGSGRVFVNLDSTPGEVAVIDSYTLKLLDKYRIASCQDPHSLSIDAAHKRLLVGCANELAVVDSDTGADVSSSTVCRREGGSAFDSDTRLLFVSCGDGTLSVIQQVSPDYYQLLRNIETEIGGPRMAYDVKTKTVLLPKEDMRVVSTADTKSPFRTEYVPGTLHLLVIGP